MAFLYDADLYWGIIKPGAQYAIGRGLQWARGHKSIYKPHKKTLPTKGWKEDWGLFWMNSGSHVYSNDSVNQGPSILFCVEFTT